MKFIPGKRWCISAKPSESASLAYFESVDDSQPHSRYLVIDDRFHIDRVDDRTWRISLDNEGIKHIWIKTESSHENRQVSKV